MLIKNQDFIEKLIINGKICSLEAIPANLKVLKLAENNLGKLPLEKLISIFKNLPKSLEALDLSDNNFSLAIISKVFVLLPANLKSLNLSGNNLRLATAQDSQCLENFKLLPCNLEILNIANNTISDYTPEQFLKLIKNIPCSLLKLDLSLNSISRLSYQTVIRALQHLPKKITVLDLGFNVLSSYSNQDLLKIFAALPKNIFFLYIAGNELDRLSFIEMQNLIEALPKKLESLDLGHNNLSKFSAQKLQAILKSLPKSLNYLDLSGNNFSRYPVKELSEIFTNLPDNLHILLLTFNGLDKYNNDELIEIFASLPKSLTQLGLGLNNLLHEKNKTFSEYLYGLFQTPDNGLTFLNQLKSSINSISFESDTIDLRQLTDILEDNYGLTQFIITRYEGVNYQKLKDILSRNRSYIISLLGQGMACRQSSLYKLPPGLAAKIYSFASPNNLEFATAFNNIIKARNRSLEIMKSKEAEVGESYELQPLLDNSIKLLDQYIERIEISDFTHGFCFFKNSQARSRAANYKLALDLRERLFNNPCEKVFASLNQLLNRRRELIGANQYAQLSIFSKNIIRGELKSIIKFYK